MPISAQKDDGSKWRHRTTAFLLAFVGSLILPVIGGWGVVSILGKKFEEENTGLDSQQDLRWNEEGAMYGNLAGSFLGIGLHFVIWLGDIIPAG